MFWVFVAIAVVGLLVFLGSVLYILGSRLPEEHVAAVSMSLDRPPREVYDAVADVAGHASWSPGVTRVERLEDREGREAWRQHMGRNSFVLITTRAEPPRVLVREIDDDHKMFSGRWEYLIEPVGAGSLVTITEYGRVPSPIPRAMMRYMIGETLYIKKHLRGLAKRFGQAARLEERRLDGVGAAAAGVR
jgi:uncharacterized protein YndB with AHSA1/START domain